MSVAIFIIAILFNSSTIFANEQDVDFPLENGDRHEILIDVKVMLNWLGYDGIQVTDYYGNWTETRVSQFQEDSGLPDSGVLDSETYNTLVDSYSSVFQEGGSHENVSEFKEQLKEIGFGGMLITDNFGSYTAQRVSDFQEYYGLDATGEANTETMLMLQELLNHPLQEGKRHNDLIEWKQKLNQLDFGYIKETDYFGSWSDNRVRAFQDTYGLVVNGIIDDPTKDKINQLISHPLQKDNRHDDLIEIKHMLNWLGYDRIAVSTYFGSWTETRVQQFQENQGIPAHGIVDELTRSHLESELTRVYQEGGSHGKIVDLKYKLDDLGFGGILKTENYGSFTAQRVGELQKYYGLATTGNINTETLLMIEEILDSPFQEGKRHPDLIDWKEKLNRLDFGYIQETDYFGNWSDNRVRSFQETYGLAVNGIIDEPTQTKINQLISHPLQVGNEHDDLIEIKHMLNWLGYDRIGVSTYFGSWMSTRVEQFQEDQGIPAHGIVDSLTRNHLENEFNRTYREGGSHSKIEDLKEKLDELGFGGILITENFGSYTATRVRDYQNYYELQVTGTITLETLLHIEDTLDHPLQKGKSHSNLIGWKEKLNALDFGYIQETNYFGSWSENRVRAFQETYGLAVNGRIDEPTQSKINSIINHPIQEGNEHDDLVEIKNLLNWLDYDGIAISTFFGSWTKTRVEQFQEDEGLPVHGIMDELTQDRLQSTFNNAFQKGGNHQGVVKLKNSLKDVGFGGMLITEYFGDYTSQRVSDFQRYYGLNVTSKADFNTWSKIEDLKNNPFQEGNSHPDIVDLKQKLNQLGFGDLDNSELFDSDTLDSLKYFQDHYSLVENGIADDPTWNKLEEILDSPYQYGKRHDYIIEIKEMLNAIGYGGIKVTNYFGSFTKQRVEEFQADYGLPVSGIVDEVTLDTLKEADDGYNYTYYDLTFDRAVDIQMAQGTPKYDGAGNIPADEANVRYYLNPSNYSKGSAKFLQFLVLDKSTNLSANELNANFLSDSGTLTNTGQAFIDAGKEYGLNELYLIAHALHETSHGTSTLAKGVGVDGNGNVIRENGKVVRDIDHKDVEHIVYNMFGYGAHDNNPTDGGAKYAFDHGWFSPEEAVVGGAERISNNYISRGQNTLYKMKWNPDYAANNNSLGPQYATHIMWAEIQAGMLHNMLGNSVNNVPLRYDIPEYQDQPGPDGSKPPAPEIEPDVNEYPNDIIGTVTVNLNLRKGPGTNHDIITTIPNGSEIEILGENGSGWLNVKYNGNEGWVSKQYVDIKNLYYVNGSGVNYRSSPAGNVSGSLSSEFVALSLDSSYNIVSQKEPLNGVNYTWYRISVNGQNYWMANEFLEKVD
ncbi:peptidoglycan-binding protein [Piscibacillus sp. B03]|uniref:peptidoglycan-binding protein n=1 Tax=Piscibacillus sp. B03 TaxID=3457430 RepID=UPI003FCDEFD9